MAHASGGKRARSYILTRQALDLVRNTLQLKWNKKVTYLGGGKVAGRLTREKISQQLEINIHTWDNISRKKGVDKDTLARVFKSLNLVLKEEYYIRADQASKTETSDSLSPTSDNQPLFGREKDIEKVINAVNEYRCVTLTGAPGVGKTQLAIAVGKLLQDKCQNKAWFVDLSTLKPRASVANLVASEFNIKQDVIVDELQAHNEDASIETIVNALKNRQLLLILDNAEHVLKECAALVRKLLTSKSVYILITSREPLANVEAKSIRIRPLDLPKRADIDECSCEQLLEYPSVALLVSRIRFHDDRDWFRFSDDNKQSIVTICEQLEGLPLALKLMAANCGTVPVQLDHVARQLYSKIYRPSVGDKQLKRQDTLQAAIDWSFNLLEDQQKILFERLSIFTAGWTLEAAHTICCSEDLNADDIEDAHEALLKKSLIEADTSITPFRYRFLKPIQEYAVRLLRPKDKELGDLQLAYVAHYADWSASAENGLRSAEQDCWITVLHSEYRNLCTALEFALDRDMIRDGLSIAGSLRRFWDRSGYVGEAREWLVKLLNAANGQLTVERVRATLALNEILFWNLEYADIEDTLRYCITYFDDHAYRADAIEATILLGLSTQLRGETDTGLKILDETLDRSLNLKDKWLEAYAKYNLALPYFMQGQLAKALSLAEEGTALFEQSDDKWFITHSLAASGTIAMASADSDKAIELIKRSLHYCEKFSDYFTMTWCFDIVAFAWHAKGDAFRALQTIRMGDNVRQQLNIERPPFLQEGYAQALANAMDLLSQADIEIATREGQRMTLEQAFEFAMRPLEA